MPGLTLTIPRRTGTLPEIVLHVLLPIFVGGMTYLAWRSRNLLMFQWFAAFDSPITSLRDWAAPFRPADWLVFSLPTALWGYSIISFAHIVWRGVRSNMATTWVVSAYALAVAPEFTQGLNIVPGTFDPMDAASVGGLALLAFQRERSVLQRKFNVS